MTDSQKTKCPRCGSMPVMARHGRSYWKAKCPNDHGLNRIEGHPMKTQRDAWLEWERAYAVQNSKQAATPV